MSAGSVKPPAIDPKTVEVRIGSSYPDELKAVAEAREKRALGDVVGLTNFGVNLVRLPPGFASSQRHWHTKEDEFVYVLEGELILITDDGEQVMTPGIAAGFPAGAENGHQLVNRLDRVAVYLEVGDRRADDECTYPDIDLALKLIDGEQVFLHKDGTPY